MAFHDGGLFALFDIPDTNHGIPANGGQLFGSWRKRCSFDQFFMTFQRLLDLSHNDIEDCQSVSVTDGNTRCE